MPKMTNPNQVRPLSVQPEDVDAYLADGWVIVGAVASAPEPVAEAAPKPTAVTRDAAKPSVSRSTKKK